jgi:hypothetical protein
MCLYLPHLSDSAVAATVADIDTKGYAVIREFVGADMLAKMQDFVAKAVERANEAYAGFEGPDAVIGSGLDELARSPVLRDLIERIYQHGTGQRPPDQNFYQILRCLTGRSSKNHSYIYHFDSYVVTFLIPIEMPVSGSRGDLLMFPNVRSLRSSYLYNAADKVILDNPITQFVLRAHNRFGLKPPIRIKMVPGDAYVFWGYRSIHTNEACDAGQVRATALFHYANPHLNRKIKLPLRRSRSVPSTA